MKIQITIKTRIFPKELKETIKLANFNEDVIRQSLSDTLKLISNSLNELLESAGSKEVSKIQLTLKND